MLSLHRTTRRDLRKAFQECVRLRSGSPLRLLMAEQSFQKGNLDLALRQYQKAENSPESRAKSLLIQDWIAFHRGNLSVGWPRYPGADFQAPVPQGNMIDSRRAIHVANPRQPHELANSLCLRRWEGHDEPTGRLLVWFNFKNSLGSELLACRLVNALRSRNDLPLTLACDPRLVSLFTDSLPECLVIDKTTDLRPLVGQGSHYVMARDLLGMLISSESDFQRIHRNPLLGSQSDRCLSETRSRPKVAISWKTTNRVQGRTRNLSIDRLSKTIANSDVEWHVGQHGDISQDIQRIQRRAPNAAIHVDTLTPHGDMLTFARELQEMDAVVTIDNTLLHLAGSLGIKTFAMIAIPGYWAWPAEGQHCRWYESVQIVRQPSPGNWMGVLDEIDTELEKLSLSRR